MIAVADVTRIPLPDQSVDLVICSPPYENARSYGIDCSLRATIGSGGPSVGISSACGFAAAWWLGLLRGPASRPCRGLGRLFCWLPT